MRPATKASGYTGAPTPYFPYVAPPAPEVPQYGTYPNPSFHALIQDLSMGITLDQRGAAGLGIGAGTVARTVEMRWEQRLTLSLFDAAVRGQGSLVQMAIEQKADPNTIEKSSGITALHLAGIHGDSAEVIEVLYRNGAKLDMVTTDGKTALQTSLQAGHALSALSLLQLRADPDKLDKASKLSALYAVLQHAPQRQNEEYMKLMQQVVEVAAVANRKTVAQDDSWFGGFFSSPETLSKTPSEEEVTNVMRIATITSVTNGWFNGLSTVLAARGNPSFVDKKSRRSALELADALLQYDIANLLRSYGGMERNHDDHEEWALCLAAARGDWEAAVEWGRVADLDWRENPPSDRLSALQYAAVEGHGDIARLLIKAGHSVDLLDARGLSAAELARQRGHRALSDYLQQLETDSHWKRAEELSQKRGGAPEDYIPASDGHDVEDGARWPVLKDLLMPPPGRELPWDEPGLEEVILVQETNVDPSQLIVKVVSCRNLEAGSFNYSLDAYVKVKVRSKEFRTNVITSSNPMFNSEFKFKLDPTKRDVVTFNVFDKDTGFFVGEDGIDDLLGRLDVPLSRHKNKLLEGSTVEIRERLVHSPKDSNMIINITLRFESKEETHEKVVTRSFV